MKNENGNYSILDDNPTEEIKVVPLETKTVVVNTGARNNMNNINQQNSNVIANNSVSTQPVENSQVIPTGGSLNNNNNKKDNSNKKKIWSDIVMYLIMLIIIVVIILLLIHSCDNSSGKGIFSNKTTQNTSTTRKTTYRTDTTSTTIPGEIITNTTTTSTRPGMTTNFVPGTTPKITTGPDFTTFPTTTTSRPTTTRPSTTRKSTTTRPSTTKPTTKKPTTKPTTTTTRRTTTTTKSTTKKPTTTTTTTKKIDTYTYRFTYDATSTQQYVITVYKNGSKITGRIAIRISGKILTGTGSITTKAVNLNTCPTGTFLADDGSEYTMKPASGCPF